MSEVTYIPLIVPALAPLSPPADADATRGDRAQTAAKMAVHSEHLLCGFAAGDSVDRGGRPPVQPE